MTAEKQKLPGKTKPPTLTLKRGKTQSLEMKPDSVKPAKSAKKK